MLHSLKSALDVNFLINTFGYPGIFAIIFAETGLFLGFFFPGDSLLITAGILASKGHLSLFILLPLLFIAAALGNLVGYVFGQRVGRKLFQKEDSRFFHKKHLVSAQDFYKKHGGKAVILARFIPIIRTFAPIVAGIIDMDFPTFMLFNVIGSIFWSIGITLVGYFLGRLIPDKYFEPIILLVVFISLLPALIELLKSPQHRESIKHLVFRRK
jgi:membrane-associated protein